LIGHYQAGREPSPELAFQPAPLPKFDGGLPGGISPTIQPPPGPPPSALQPQGSGSGPIRVPPLTPDKATQYAALFEKSGAVNGHLPGEQAKQIFERAGLPNEVLGRIWTLADTEQKGALQATEFVIAMHLLASFKAGQLRALPNILPAGLYEAAARRAPSRQSTGSLPAIPRQFSGNPAQRAGSPLSRSFPPPPPPQVHQHSGLAGGNGWAISPSDKAKFDGIYMGLDKTNKGFITGDEAVPFFSESKLPEEVLAQIWDLSDIRSAGVLTRDEFAVAMYLIRQQRGKRDDRDSLPSTLPQNLVPPSMRNQVRPPDVPTAPAFDAAPTLPKSAAEDLFGLDALASPSTASPPAPVQQPLSTGGSGAFDIANDPFGNNKTMTPTSPAQPPSGLGSSSVFKPFTPSSSFGQSLNQQGTGGSNSAPMQRGFQPQRSATEDLLGDTDPEESKKFTNESAELGNLSNQVSSLSSKMQEVQAQKVNTQNELSQSSAQKQQFEQRLAQLRTLYEQEAQSVKSLDEKLTASRNETKDLQTKIAMIEGSYQDLQNQHRQTAAALQADQQENASLKERMRVMNAEITQMKPTLEKLRSDARQQKGLVAINKKQLATNEAEREKMKAEAEELNRSIQEDTKTLAEQARAQSPPHVASPAQVASPAPSSMSANNPFFRRQASTSEISSPPFASPAHQTDRSFENVFGPAFGGTVASPALGGPPPTSFGHGVDTPPVPNTLSRATTGHGELSSPGASSPATSHRELPTAQSTIPPPPESREISSSFLPFPSHEDSVTSSRQVSAPNSRFGEDSTGADTPTNYLGNTPTGSSSAGPPENALAASPNIDLHSTASPVSAGKDAVTMPGAFPDTGVVATPTGGSTLSEQAASDPFSMNQDPARSATSKDDFDSAFAGFGAAAKPQERMNTGSSTGGSNGGAPPVFNKEFPPIAELENDDDSESASETGGFDDDFAPASPGHTRQISSTQSITTAKPAPTEEPNDFLSVRPMAVQNASALSLGSLPPTPGAQVSPPAYDKTISPSETAHNEVQSFSGLLPTREIPTSPPPAAPANAPPTTFTAATVSAQPVPPPKVSFGDDFDEFDDLEDAKEGDADDEFAKTSTERSGLDDFNPMFDSPPQSKGAEHAPQNGFSNDSMFGDFTSSPQTTQPKPSASASATNAVNDNHDWDAIFAGLDGPAARDPSPVKIDAPTSNGTALAPERPQIGRALTEAGVHDDPILKNLTGMGYARNDALAALEKYDYNLERVSSWLQKNATQH
jgi:epidermal growth factor receptor substrate 15